jgi:anti-sigma B factor antagonist
VLDIRQSEAEPGIGLITLGGKALIGAQSHKIEEAVRNLLGRGCRVVILEMSALTHMDSTGMGQVIASLNMAMQSKAKLVAAAAVPGVREGFRVTRLDTVIPFYEDLAAALTAARS